MKTLILALCAAVCVAGCATTTDQNLRETHATSYEFSVDKPYMKVYQTAVTNMSNCYITEGFGGGILIASSVGPTLGTAEVGAVMQNYGVRKYNLLLDIERSHDSASRVHVYADNGWQNRARLIRDWFVDGTSTCGDT